MRIPVPAPLSTVVSVVTADGNGIATAGIAAQSPGFPVVAFFPFSGDTLPAPPPALFPPGNMFYVTVRVLPFDDCSAAGIHRFLEQHARFDEGVGFRVPPDSLCLRHDL